MNFATYHQQDINNHQQGGSYPETQSGGFSKPQFGFPSGYFKIRSRSNGKCLDVNGGKTVEGTRVVLYNCNNGLHQQWYIDKIGRVVNRHSGLALDVRGNSDGNGTAVQINKVTGGTNQQWSVDSVGRIISKKSKKNLTFDENNQGDLLPVYIWETYNSPTQRWYFERVGEIGVNNEIVLSHKLSQGTFIIPQSKLSPSDEYTYQFWFRLNKFTPGKWHHIYHKGDASGTLRSPGLWLYPQQPRFHVRMSTTKNINEGCDPNYSLRKDVWTNIAHVVNGRTVQFYIDGNLSRQCQLSGFPDTGGNNPLYIFHDPPGKNWGWADSNLNDYEIKSMTYSNKAHNLNEIRKQLDLTRGDLEDETDDQPIKIISRDSDDSWPLGKSTHRKCAPLQGELNSKFGWCAAAANKTGWNNNYLSLRFGKVHRVRKIQTQGRHDADQWVTRYGIQYKNPSTGKWIKLGEFDGNNDRDSVVTRNTDFTAADVRIYPFKWNGHPSLRVGFRGTVEEPQKPIVDTETAETPRGKEPQRKETNDNNKCATYLKMIKEAPTAADRVRNQEMYNKECRKISYYKHLEALEKEKDKYEKLYELIATYKNKDKISHQKAKDCSFKITELSKKIQHLKIDVELEKNRRCPPTEKCLPLITPLNAQPVNKVKELTVNDFDIRTHKDFHKYVMATNVKPCNTQELAEELERCQAKFMETYVKKTNCKGAPTAPIAPIRNTATGLTAAGLQQCAQQRAKQRAKQITNAESKKINRWW